MTFDIVTIGHFGNLKILTFRFFDNLTILKFDICKVMFDGSVEELKKTNITQPAIFIHSTILAKCILGTQFKCLNNFVILRNYLGGTVLLKIVQQHSACINNLCKSRFRQFCGTH